MPDFLTHVLVTYVLLTVVSWRVDWLTEAYVAVGMAGALIPDLKKITLVVPDYRVEALLGVPFGWTPLHRFGGVILTAALLSLFAESEGRRGVFALLVGAALLHLVLDAFLIRPGPTTYNLLYPLTEWRFPVLDVDLYLSSDYWPSVMSALAAVVVLIADRRRSGTRDVDPEV